MSLMPLWVSWNFDSRTYSMWAKKVGILSRNDEPEYTDFTDIPLSSPIHLIIDQGLLSPQDSPSTSMPAQWTLSDPPPAIVSGSPPVTPWMNIHGAAQRLMLHAGAVSPIVTNGADNRARNTDPTETVYHSDPAQLSPPLGNELSPDGRSERNQSDDDTLDNADEYLPPAQSSKKPGTGAAKTSRAKCGCL